MRDCEIEFRELLEANETQIDKAQNIWGAASKAEKETIVKIIMSVIAERLR